MQISSMCTKVVYLRMFNVIIQLITYSAPIIVEFGPHGFKITWQAKNVCTELLTHAHSMLFLSFCTMDSNMG
jgi:hypothetical protein